MPVRLKLHTIQVLGRGVAGRGEECKVTPAVWPERSCFEARRSQSVLDVDVMYVLRILGNILVLAIR